MRHDKFNKHWNIVGLLACKCSVLWSSDFVNVLSVTGDGARRGVAEVISSPTPLSKRGPGNIPGSGD